jgi:mono/diheme cytochrome c family protein
LFTIHIVAVALLATLSSAACKNDSAPSGSGAQNAQASVSASPAAGDPAGSQAGAQPAAEATPATTPTTPVGPIGLTAASQGDGTSQERGTIGNIPMTVTKAKPPMTPEPDPFPPRPTPAVVMKDGKIVQQWQAPADAANLVNPVKSRPDAVKLGREFYMQKCVDCHGKNGQGNGWMSANTKRDGKPLPPTNLTSKVVQANTDGELFWKITNGRSPMPAHRVRFDDEQRWLIVAYLRTLKK